MPKFKLYRLGGGGKNPLFEMFWAIEGGAMFWDGVERGSLLKLSIYFFEKTSARSS